MVKHWPTIHEKTWVLSRKIEPPRTFKVTFCFCLLLVGYCTSLGTLGFSPSPNRCSVRLLQIAFRGGPVGVFVPASRQEKRLPSGRRKCSATEKARLLEAGVTLVFTFLPCAVEMGSINKNEVSWWSNPDAYVLRLHVLWIRFSIICDPMEIPSPFPISSRKTSVTFSSAWGMCNNDVGKDTLERGEC